MIKKKGWTLFLDRDGVINKRLPGDYVKSWESFEFLPGVLQALSMLKDRFEKIVVVTNQQGIGKDLMTVSDLDAIHARMLEAVSKAGGRIDAVLYCPEMATRPNNCRKPAPDMALQAQHKFPDITFAQSLMAGDTPADVEFGHRLGMKTVFIGNSSQYKMLKVRAGRQCSSLKELAECVDEIIG